ncbi:MAG: hypothetical protein K1060chlam5_01212 [Candidatus Anoxychlamydiales bacterium]|nr:hypothetical protein [Candidatus Anoxychlamydiales bacterium]
MKKVSIKKPFFITSIFFMSLLVVFTSTKSFVSSKMISYEYSWQKEIKNIDNKIEELEKLKRGYKSESIKHKNQAQRLQFQNGELQTAKKHWQLADENSRIVLRIEKKIDELKIQKKEIISKNS